MPSISIQFIRGSDVSSDAFEATMDELLDYAIDITPIRTGALMRAWVLYAGPDEAELLNGQDYASYIDEGISEQAPNGLIGPILVQYQNLIGYYSGMDNDIAPLLDDGFDD